MADAPSAPLLGTSSARFRRYTMLRAVQRSFYSMRPLSGALPADAELREIRERLRALGPDPADGAPTPERATAGADIDERLLRVSTELRGLVEATPFSELRATLPAASLERREEVAALLDLLLDDGDLCRFADLIDYLVTLLTTESLDGMRRATMDPMAVTPSLYELCESIDGYERPEIDEQVSALSEAILELAQSQSAGPVIERMRSRKASLGRLRFVPEVFRKVVEYNLSVWNCLEDEIAAERTLHDVETFTHDPLLSELDAEEDAATGERSPWIDPEDFEQLTREEMLIHDVAEQLGIRVSQGECDDAKAGAIAARLDLTRLSRWEQRALNREEPDESDGLVRCMTVVGLLLRAPDEVGPLLEDMGLELERFELAWVPKLDEMVQGRIASLLAGDDYELAKDLARSRARYLHSTLRRAQRERARRPQEPRPDGEADLHWEAEPVEITRYARRSRRRPKEPKDEHRRWTGERIRLAVIAALLLSSLTWAGFEYATAKTPRTIRQLTTSELLEVSPYLKSGYQSELGHGTRFFGTTTDEWYRQTLDQQVEEAIRIAKKLRVHGVTEVFLIDQVLRLQTHTVGDRLLFPTPGNAEPQVP